LRNTNHSDIRILISIINLGEICYTVGRRRGLTFALHQVAQIRQLPIEILPVDEALVMQAATYKMRHPISYADAFALATAVREGAILMTGDPEFGKLQAIFDIELLQRNNF
jgi:predicted nucleic acid-binding protein